MNTIQCVQLHVPVQPPCYDFVPVTDYLTLTIKLKHTTLVHCNLAIGNRLPDRDGQFVRNFSAHSPRHDDPRLLAIPPS